MERRDAYTVLSLYSSYSSCTEGSQNSDKSDRGEEFDIGAEKEFWGEIKRGLVRAHNLFTTLGCPPLVGDNHSTSDSLLCFCF